MKTLLRVAGVTASAAVGMAVAWVTADALRRTRTTRAPPPAVTREAAMRAFDGERALATGLGMTLAEEGDAPVERSGVTTGVWSREVGLDARECVAVIAAVTGHHAPVALALQPAGDGATRIATGTAEPLTETRAEGGLVAQVQWCQHEARRRVAVLETRAVSDLAYDRPLQGAVHYAVYRGRWDAVGGPARLRRGAPRSWALQQFPAEHALEEAARRAPEGRALGVPVPLRVDGARLIPGSADTYRALYERVRGGRDLVVNPRVDASRPPGDPWETGLPNNFSELYASLRGGRPAPRVHDPVLDVGPDATRRVLAVIDTGRLGARCVALHFTRTLYLHRAALWRVGPGDAALVALPAEGNSVTDRACPAGGVALYAVDHRDQDEWLLRVVEPPAAPDAVAAPATDAAEPEAPARRTRGRRHRRRR